MLFFSGFSAVIKLTTFRIEGKRVLFCNVTRIEHVGAVHGVNAIRSLGGVVGVSVPTIKVVVSPAVSPGGTVFVAIGLEVAGLRHRAVDVDAITLVMDRGVGYQASVGLTNLICECSGVLGIYRNAAIHMGNCVRTKTLIVIANGVGIAHHGCPLNGVGPRRIVLIPAVLSVVIRL